MSDDTIFSDPTKSTEAPKAGIVLPDEAKELIGEGKKYASVEEALKALPHAQKHISTIEEENKRLREKAEGGQSAEEVLRTVQELLKAEKQATPALAGMDESSVAAILDRKLAQKALEDTAKANVSAVTTALRAKFGDKAEEMYKAKAAELGVSVSFLNDVAKASPKAALEMFSLKVPVTTSSNGSVNTEVLPNTIHTPAKQPRIMGGATTEQIMAAWRAAKSN